MTPHMEVCGNCLRFSAFERGLCPRNPALGEAATSEQSEHGASEGGEAPSEFYAQMPTMAMPALPAAARRNLMMRSPGSANSSPMTSRMAT